MGLEEDVKAIREILSPNLTGKDSVRFNELAERISEQQRVLTAAAKQHEEALKEAELPVKETRLRLQKAEEELVLVNGWINDRDLDRRVAGRAGVVWGRVREVLADPNLKLPLVLKPLNLIVWLLAHTPHPSKDPFLSLRDQAQVRLEDAQNANREIISFTDGESGQRIGELAVMHQRDKGRFVEFCEDQAASSYGILREFVGVFPGKAESVVRKYAKMHLDDPEVLLLAPSFLKRIGLSDVDVTSLRGPQRHQWQDFVIWQLLEELHGQGLIAKPEMPESLSSSR